MFNVARFDGTIPEKISYLLKIHQQTSYNVSNKVGDGTEFFDCVRNRILFFALARADHIL